MPDKRTSRSAKPARKAVARKTHAPRKAAKPAARKIRVVAVKAKVARPIKTRSQKPARPVVAARPALKPLKTAPAVREPAMLKPPRMPGSFSPVSDSRPTFAAIQPRLNRRPFLNDEDDESATGHSLLLGPRNVRPYLERKGEQYMGRDQLQHFRGILASWKRDLMEEVDRTMTHMKDEAANPPDPNDRATLESEFALELRTRDRERKLIRKIEEALNRIDDGSYGYCIETGEPIGVKRLEARPVATLCIEAQERRERREKQYGDRDDWYR